MREKLDIRTNTRDSYINFLLVTYHIFKIPYRQLEGFIRALSRYYDLKPIDHSTIHERSMKLNLHKGLCDTDNITISVIASGIKVSKRIEEFAACRRIFDSSACRENQRFSYAKNLRFLSKGKVEKKEGIPEDPFCGRCKNEEYRLLRSQMKVSGTAKIQGYDRESR
ncbi:MAG: hypothetical protein MOIL_01717 [Candidatus Methanolliviera sp. GoM_oil]|nr:MAG: hypothetical protein MOIL_01717 [Candidatus Methanolliviera sp. GoM_oil]